ncbi:MAG: proline hydroxylase [Rhodospirillaceae bacterium]|jgi:ectoine hydroxylase|nr:proline hydroxylase [Rhodospirillaceae bacterium]MBT6118873.1 proline hydroxylase [Rhodospirillaceae bacterium]
MKLTDAQLEQFDRDGFLILPSLFDPKEVEAINAELPALFAEDRVDNVREKGGGIVRTAMNLHARNDVFAKLVRHPRLLEPALQILDGDVYLQQVKVNAKEAYTGEIWQWHYDFAHHHNEDGNPLPLALNVHLFLDECNPFNGALWFIPGSHKAHDGRNLAKSALDTETTSYELWTVDHETVGRMIEAGGIVPAHGPAGTVLIFGELMVHGSPNNMSPWPRHIFSTIYNPISNRQTTFKRPDWQHGRDFTPTRPLPDDCLRERAA